MANLPVYSSREVKISYLNQSLSGLAPDSFVEFSLNSDLTDEEVGADGSVSISISPDQTGTCTISLEQQSPGNIFLSSVLQLQRSSGKLAIGSFTITDPSGSIIAKLSDAHIKIAPTIGLGSSATGSTRDWVIFCSTMHFLSVPEGIGSAASELTDAVATIESIGSFLN